MLPLQQPLGQLVPSQMQTPLAQRCPGPHAALVPHWQVPLPEQLSAFCGSHATQVAPAAPHVASPRARHSVPSQQPDGHEVASHTQMPLTQRWPGPHGGPSPHWQAPPWHRSAALELQLWHEAPPAPQSLGDGVTHAFCLQQPEGHDNASQTHAPPLHRWPEAHALPEPHRHVPSGPQPSALAPSQAMHAPPRVPQLCALLGRHTPPEQHPSAQLAAVQPQAPCTQAVPLSQLWHALPPEPHASAVSPERQRSPRQQPGQLDGLHTHRPPTQAWPVSHAGPAPHRHWPRWQSSDTLASHGPQRDASATATSTSRPTSTTAVASPAATTLPSSKPSTRTFTSRPPSASARSNRIVCGLASGSPGALGASTLRLGPSAVTVKRS